MSDSEILKEAEGAVCRGVERYGEPERNLEEIAALWSAYLGIDVDRRDVACLMILLKIARVKSGHEYDSLVDIAGYAELLYRSRE